jgi:hypothetical protein
MRNASNQESGLKRGTRLWMDPLSFGSTGGKEKPLVVCWVEGDTLIVVHGDDPENKTGQFTLNTRHLGAGLRVRT